MNGKLTEDMKYVAPVRVSSYQVDSTQLLRATAFMDLAQEIAYLASNATHAGFEDLRRNHIVWVLSRMQMRFLRMPRWGEDVVLQTWYKGPMGLFCLRDFLMLDANGQRLIEATSCWTVIDIASRRMVRGEDIATIASPDYICRDAVITDIVPKVITPRDLAPQPVGEHVVAYSDIDVVGHTNNARYLVWALDTLDPDFLATHPLSEVTINFNQETRSGQTVNLLSAATDSQRYITGQVDGRQAFAIALNF